MRIVNVWGTYIDLDHVLAIEEEPRFETKGLHDDILVVNLILHMAFRDSVFRIQRAHLPDELKRDFVPVRDRETTGIRGQGPSALFLRTYHGEWIPLDSKSPELLQTSLMYVRAVQALDLLRELWGGRGNIDIPTIPRDSIVP